MKANREHSDRVSGAFVEVKQTAKTVRISQGFLVPTETKRMEEGMGVKLTSQGAP